MNDPPTAVGGFAFTGDNSRGFALKVAKQIGESRYHQAVAGGPDTSLEEKCQVIPGPTGYRAVLLTSTLRKLSVEATPTATAATSAY